MLSYNHMTRSGSGKVSAYNQQVDEITITPDFEKKAFAAINVKNRTGKPLKHGDRVHYEVCERLTLISGHVGSF
jgi:hypothetical protein